MSTICLLILCGLAALILGGCFVATMLTPEADDEKRSYDAIWGMK